MYIDPNTGGILFQILSLLVCIGPVLLILIAVVVGVVVYARKSKPAKQGDSEVRINPKG